MSGGTTQKHDENSDNPPIRSATMSAPSNATLMKYIELCSKRRDLLREIKRDKAELEYNLSLIARNEEKLELLHFIRDDDPTSQNRANFRYRKYEPSSAVIYKRYDYRSTSPNMVTYCPYKFKPQEPNNPQEPPEKHTLLAQWITRSYSFNSGVGLLRADNQAPDSSLELLWHHSDAIMCCPLKPEPVFTFANLVGLDMLQTKLDHLKYATLNLTNFLGSKNSFRVHFSDLTAEQGIAYLPAGRFGWGGKMGRYDQCLVWKVFNDEGRVHCMAFMFVNCSLVIVK